MSCDRVLEFDGLHKRYGRITALRGITFDVRAGQLFGFVGANGAGKTTTMRIALGVLAGDGGGVRWRGVPLDAATRRRIGYMPEERGLYPKMKVGQQLVYFARLHGLSQADAGVRAQAWLERLGVADRRDDELQKLSLGNQQRVQLAAALVHDPEILVLDEPFSGLDPVAVDVMSEVLREKCAQGTPVMFSSHQLDLVERLCDVVGIVANGEMVAYGTIDRLLADGPVEYVVDAPAARPDWAERIPGVLAHRREGSITYVRLADGADDQVLLRAATATGPVHEFRRRRHTLTERFRDVVTVNGSSSDEKQTEEVAA